MFDIVHFETKYVEGVEKIEQACFSVPWTRQGIESELTDSTARFFVALSNGEAVGYIGAHFVVDEGYIANLAVLPKYRCHGIGRALVQRLLMCAKKDGLAFVSLEVRQSNSNAVLLYEKNGFKNVGVRKNFYSAPREDAYIMTLNFKE